jgi:hypothetical protein
MHLSLINSNRIINNDILGTNMVLKNVLSLRHHTHDIYKFDIF